MPAQTTGPDAYHTVTPYLSAENAAELIGFLSDVFGARLRSRLDRPDGLVMHAELMLGDSTLMISDACAYMGPMPAALYLYVDDVDTVYRQALSAGAQSTMEPADMFWGDRMAQVRDRWGNLWSLAKQVEVVSEEEVARRAKAFAEQMPGQG